MKTIWMALAALGALAASGPATAQRPNERVFIPGEGQGTLTFYARPNYRGQATTFRAGEANINPPLYPGSVRAEGPWRLCPEVRLRGRCVYANSSYPTAEALGLRFNVRSIGPGGPNDPTDPGPLLGPGQGGAAGGESLRGTASQYFPQPRYGNQRVQACQNSSNSLVCARQSADRFCQQASPFRRAYFFDRETRPRGTFLVDVLCSNRAL